MKEVQGERGGEGERRGGEGGGGGGGDEGGEEEIEGGGGVTVMRVVDFLKDTALSFSLSTNLHPQPNRGQRRRKKRR